LSTKSVTAITEVGFMRVKWWRRGSESNRRIKVLQTSPLPLGYRAPAQFKHRSEPAHHGAQSQLEDKEIWSGRRDLNPRLRPWQGRTLPLSYSRFPPHSTTLSSFPHLCGSRDEVPKCAAIRFSDVLLLSLACCGVNIVHRHALRTVPQHRLNHIRRHSGLGKPRSQTVS
jgi:hypothetical protein